MTVICGPSAGCCPWPRDADGPVLPLLSCLGKTPRKGPWWEGYANPEVDALIEDAQATVSDADRQAIYRRIYALIRDDAPWLFLYNPTLYWAARADVAWTPRTDGLLVFR